MNRSWTSWRMLAAILALPVGACGTSSAEEPRAVDAAVAERGDLRITAEATGTVEPIRKVEVKSKAGGEILELGVDVGDEVDRGTLLATIDPRDVRNRFNQVQADLEVAEARAQIAEAQLRRQEQLRESGVITDQELETAKLEHSNAQASLIKARTDLELAELQLTDVTIRAPMKGTVLEKSVEEGQVIQSASGNVSGGTTLFIMANLDEMQVRTLVDETDMGELRAGMTAVVQVEAYPNRVFEGVIEKVEPQAVVEQNVTMFPVIVRLSNESGLLRPGMNAEVEILIDEAHDVLLVPNSAIVMPQDAAPAAMALGLDPDQLDMPGLRSMGRFAGPMPGGAGGAGGAGTAAGGSGAAPGGGAPGADADNGGASRPGRAGGQGRTGGAAGSGGAAGDGPGGAIQALRDSLRKQVEAGEIGQDSVRTLIRSRMAAAGGAGMARADAAGSGPAPTGDRQIRRAVVFVVGSDGTPAPKVVEIGLNDWDFTQVVSGLQEGDQLAVIGAAQLQARQQEMLDRIRSRRGGPF